MRKWIVRMFAGGLVAGLGAAGALAQNSASTNFTTGFTPKNLKNVPIDTSKAMRQYGYNNPSFMANTARQTKAFSLTNFLPKVNLPGTGSNVKLNNSPLTNHSPLLQKSAAMQK